MYKKKVVSIFELVLIVISIVSFAYFVSTDLPEVFTKQNSLVQYMFKPIIPMVSASSAVPSGCCKETTSGATCQEMVLSDKALCKTDLVGAGCTVVSECQKGCCYDSDSGICSLNAPREKCTSNGGEWDQSSTCNIPQCQVGCCILGDGAAMTTTRECTQMAADYRIEKVFKPLDNKGSCDAYAELTDEGACLFPSDDYSKLNNCIYTTKGKCTGSGKQFKEGYLCTSNELNTSCEKSEKTSCIDGDDRVYFVDSCGNKANVYDSSKVNNQNYWEKVIAPSQSCTGSPETCGNCDYTTGSICTKYVNGMDITKPTLGSYVCKNLNCANGKKHGESWCVSDAQNASKIAGSSIGSRNYVASCFEGQIQIEGCADFNQEICIQNKDETLGYTEAACVMNDWRSCIYANDFDNYAAIEKKCEMLPQCVMFNEIPGNEKYAGLPGFKEGISNDAQGKAGSVGAGMNKFVMQCVPRFTPGYQFWTATTNSNPFSKATSTKVSSSESYGGSKQETDSICGLSTFKCVSHIRTTTPLTNPSPSDVENPECNMQAVSQSNQKVSLMMEALNEKCRALGSCGVQYNTQGQLGSAGFKVSRVYVDKGGQSHANYSTQGYVLSEEYLNKTLIERQDSVKMGKIANLTMLLENVGASFAFDTSELIANSIISSGTNNSLGKISGADSSGGEKVFIADKSQMGTVAGLSLMGASLVVNALAGSTAGVAAGSLFGVVAFAAVGAIIGAYIGGMIASASGMSPGESTAFIGAMAGLGGAGFTGLAAWAGLCGPCPPCCIIIAIIMIIYMIYSLFTGEDNEYYVTSFECKAWQPPLVGKCEECNSDVRPCSENKCRSIGNNCRYFVDNGEPGYCATLSDVWSAKISPWNEKLTSGNKYTNVSNSGFKIVSDKQNSKEVDAWKAVRFGIITDKEAICKIDTNHSKKFDEMRYTMISDKNYATGKTEGRNHWIAVSPHVAFGDSEIDEGITTPPMNEGDNEYYILCQNFAGTINGAPFVVNIKQAQGPDLTAAMITRTTPNDKSYLAYNSNNMTLWLYLDEPAECRYSIEYDYNFFEEMPNNMSCLTGKDQGFYGEWPCMAIIPNLTQNTKMYIKCKDQPGLNETDLYKRNQNRQSFQYEFFVCQTGLEITSVVPRGIVEVNSSQGVNLEVRTSGCINEGEANCAYRLPYYGDTYSNFYSTGSTVHSQPLTTLGTGERTVNIDCQDDAGNMANTTVNFTVFIDDSAPGAIRVFEENNNIVLVTNEEANCAVNINATKACDFSIPASDTFVTKHSITLSDAAKKQILYIRCEDKKGNAPTGCTDIIKLVNLKNAK